MQEPDAWKNSAQMQDPDSWQNSVRIQAKPLWFENWYDGPLDGLCEVDGGKAWFVALDEVELDGREEIIFAATKLSPELAAELMRRQDERREICGELNYLDGRCKNGCEWPTDEQLARFEEISKSWPALEGVTDGEMMGWFTM